MGLGRHLDERLALRAPWLFRLLMRLLLALPVDSPARRRGLRWIGERGWAAFSRGDEDVIMLFIDGDVELNHIGIPFPDLAESYRGSEEFLEFGRLWRAAWEGAELTHTPEAVIDLGDRVVWRVRLTARGESSGASINQTCGFVQWLADGMIVRSDAYYQWSDCVDALGLDEIARTVSP